jgi:Large extracellular alpha-helical protein
MINFWYLPASRCWHWIWVTTVWKWLHWMPVVDSRLLVPRWVSTLLMMRRIEKRWQRYWLMPGGKLYYPGRVKSEVMWRVKAETQPWCRRTFIWIILITVLRIQIGGRWHCWQTVRFIVPGRPFM